MMKPQPTAHEATTLSPHPVYPNQSRRGGLSGVYPLIVLVFWVAGSHHANASEPLGDLSIKTIAQLASVVADHLDPAAHNDEVTYLEPVVRELGKRGTPAIPVLLSALHSCYLEASVTEELARIGEASIVPVLNALDAQGDRELEPIHVMIRLAQAEPTRQATRRELIRALSQDSRPLVRKNVARVLTKLCDPSTAAALTEALKDKDEVVRAHAATGVSVVCPGSSAPALCNLLKDPSALVREDAARALAKIRDPASVGAMMDAVRQCRDESTSWYLAEALGALGDRRAVGPLIQCMSGSKDGTAIRFCAEALGTLGDMTAIGPLKAVLARKEMPTPFFFADRILPSSLMLALRGFDGG